jgi:D-beta-D-heptose 7-phosphate kinase/D-beta-D-heptose 1-phosphate adenosyltransferase
VSADRIVSWDAAAARRAAWAAEGKRVVFTNGCFDILHAGHVRLLEEARAQGDTLILGLNDDASVRRLKGAERPINPAADRAEVLAGLRAVDLVVLFGEDTPAALIARLVPDVLVKGGDYSEDTVVGAPTVKAAGGRVHIVPLHAGRATSELVKKIRTFG